MRCVPEPDDVAPVPIVTTTVCPTAIAPPSPAQIVIVSVCPETATDACSVPLQSGAVVNCVPLLVISTSSSMIDESVNPDGKTNCIVSPSAMSSANVIVNV